GKQCEKPGALVRDDIITIRKLNGTEFPVMPTSKLAIPGPHNIANACAAVSCTIPFDLPVDALADGLRKFEGLPHRLQFVGAVNGVRFINDSKATNTDALECALRSFDEKVVLIAGGYDKGANFAPLRELVGLKVKHVVLVGATASRIRADWDEVVPMTHATSFEEAIYKAKAAAEQKGVVLLAPGCASFDMFENFEKRGEKFAEIVTKIIRGK
ncbi:UDP-N-acetylmuramoyl-L-alanine--D-glutamate ligase, partial [bacterium]